jgi:hypothetical protein
MAAQQTTQLLSVSPIKTRSQTKKGKEAKRDKEEKGERKLISDAFDNLSSALAQDAEAAHQQLRELEVNAVLVLASLDEEKRRRNSNSAHYEPFFIIEQPKAGVVTNRVAVDRDGYFGVPLAVTHSSKAELAA